MLEISILYKNINKILLLKFFFIIMVLSLINLMINKYTSYFPTLLEHRGTQASSRKGQWPALQKNVEDHLSRSVVFNLCYAYPPVVHEDI